MRRKSDAHNSPTSARASSYSNDDESFISSFEDKFFYSALYEFSQGLGPVQIWEYINSNKNLMKFVVNTPPPDLDSSTKINNGEKVTNIVSKFEDLYYIALYSHVLDCQARGFVRSIVLVVANQSREIIKFVYEAYIDDLTTIMGRIYENSYKLFLNEIHGYSISLLKTAEETNSQQLKSKFKELKTYLPNFGIDIDTIMHQKSDQISSENNSNISFNGEVKDESFFTKINNDLRSVRTITDFDRSILEDLQDLITNLPKTDTNAAISAHIDVGSFRELKSYKKYIKSKTKISDKSTDQFSSSSSNLIFEKVKSTSTNSSDNEIISKSSADDKSLEISDIPNKSKNSRRQTTKDNEPNKKKTESIINKKKNKKQTQFYGLDYQFDLNFGGFKGQYSRLVTYILNTNYDASVFTLQWLVRFKVFHSCAFTILSGGTLVIVTAAQDTEHGKMLADRFSLLAPHSLIKGHSRTIKKHTKSGDLNVYNLDEESSSDDDDDIFSEDSQIVLVKDSVEPRECFKYSIVVTNRIKQSPVNFHSFPIVTTFSKSTENDESLLSVLDLTTNVYKGDGCPDSSFVMKELGKETSLCLSGSNTTTQSSNISSFSSVAQVGQIQQSQTQTNIELNNKVAIASSSSSFSQIFKRKQKSSNKKTVNSPPSPLSMQSNQYLQQQPNQKLASLRNYSSSIITMSGSNSNSNLASSQNEDVQLPNQKSMITVDTENEVSISEIDSEFSGFSNQKTTGLSEIGIGTYSGLRHYKRPFRPSFLSDASTISSSASAAAVVSSESENLFVLNMYATINRVVARFIRKLAEFAENEIPPSKDELMKKIGFSEDDEPILKYWIYCFFNKQKCRPVLFNNKSNVGFTVISMYK